MVHVSLRWALVALSSSRVCLISGRTISWTGSSIMCPFVVFMTKICVVLNVFDMPTTVILGSPS